MPADFKDAARLGQRFFNARHITYAKGDGVEIETFVGKSKRLGIALHQRDLVAQPRIAHARRANIEHRGVDIDKRGMGKRPRPFLKAQRNVARATRNVDMLQAFVPRRVCHGDEDVFPCPVQAARHQVIHHIIFAGDMMEYIIDPRLLLPQSDNFIAKGDGLCLVIQEGVRHRGDTSERVREKLGKAMPELPEVETVRRGLAPALENAVIDHVTLHRADLRFPFTPHFARRLKGAKITAVERRAKYLLFGLDTGDTLLAHLGMSGRFRLETPKGKALDPGLFYETSQQNQKHDHVVITFKGGRRLIYNDARRFGFMELLTPRERLVRFKDMGAEPLAAAFNGKALARAIEGKAMAIKPALLDQSVIAGIGNIYACEALFDAKINPKQAAEILKNQQIQALVKSLKKVLRKAITLGGSTLRDFSDSKGKNGSFQQQFCVYDRAGKACPRCGTEIEKFNQSGRSTFWCPHCQA